MNERRTPFLVGLAAAAAFLVHSPTPPPPETPAPGKPTLQALAADARIFAADAGSPASRQQRHRGRKDTATATAAAADAAATAAAAAQRLQPSRREYARLYRDLLGIEAPPPAAPAFAAARIRGRLAAEPLSVAISAQPQERPVDDRDLAAIATAARQSSYRLEFMIALAADPIDSGLASDFDLTMSSLQLGLAESGYRFDRQWLPWVEPDAADEKKYRETAGIMLFRREGHGHRRPGKHPPQPDPPAPTPPAHQLLAVFVVGETLKLGVQKPAFERAVDFILDLHAQDAALRSRAPAGDAAPEAAAAALAGPARGPARLGAPPPDGAARCLEIPVLGPSYSGSVASLRLALASVRRRTCFRIVSGSASAPGLEKRMEAPLPGAAAAAVTVQFSRTVVPDDVLEEKGLGFLEDQLGWDLNRAALLVERDTAYGSYFSDLPPDPSAPPRRLSRITKLTFPSGLFALRNAWEASASFAPPAQAVASNPAAFATPKTSLDVSLADQRTPIDVVPELSPLTARIYDMAIADLLREIAAEGFSYVGILATDVKDQLFLAEQIRRWAPNVILFVIDNNLLYVHPQYSTAMFGTLTISSFPLATEGGRPAMSPATLEPRVRRQFASERQEGTFLAVRNLVRHAPFPRTVWIAASGNYAMWPLAALDARDGPPFWPVSPEALGPLSKAPASAVAAPEPLGPSRPETRTTSQPEMPRLAERADLKLAILMFVLCLVSYLLRREAFDWSKLQAHTRLQMTAALALLCLAGTFIVCLWTAKVLSRISDSETLSGSGWLLPGALGLGYGYLAWSFIRADRLFDWPKRAFAALALAGLPLLLAVTWATFKLWRVDADGLFYQRAIAFSGGVSPLTSLAWFAEAAFFWLVVELKRQVLRERHKADWPLARYDDPALASCYEKAGKIGRLLRTALPRDQPAWLAVAVIIAPAFAFLWSRVQPIGESRLFGRVFLLLGTGLSALSAVAFVRFLRAWRHLSGLLHRVELTDLLAALEEVAPEVGWKPTHFTWYVPSFTVLQRSVERLQRLVDRTTIPELQGLRALVEPAGQPTLRQLLEDTFTEVHKERLSQEIAIRNELNRRFRAACNSLGALRSLPAVREFYAIRLIAYLRHVFNQLRYSVMGAMGCGLSLIVGTASLAFQPKGYTSLVLWTMLAVASAATLVVFVQMDRDTTLSAIASTDAGKVTYNWSFVSKILIYVLPVLGLIASQFPSVGRVFNSLFDPLVRVLGSG